MTNEMIKDGQAILNDKLSSQNKANIRKNDSISKLINRQADYSQKVFDKYEQSIIKEEDRK